MKRKILITGIFTILNLIDNFTVSSNEKSDSFQNVIEETEKDTLQVYFKYYERICDKYLSLPAFDGSPLSGKLLADIAKETYEETGILVPPELCLAQAQWESGMGRFGRSPETNPFNVGEYDTDTGLVFNSLEEGVRAYYRLMANDYLCCGRTVNDLLNNFVNHEGRRYASDTTYERKLKTQIQWMKRNFDFK